MARTDTTTLSCVLHVLPWVLVIVGALLFVIGLSWRNLSSTSDTANAPLVITGILLTMLAGAMSCANDRAPERDYEPQEPPEPQEAAPEPAPEQKEAPLPFVPI
jgi:hypothetical protein